MKENKKKVILIVLALLSIVAITIGITYAFFNYAKEGTTDNTITAGTIEFLYTENPIAGRGIALVDAMPMSDTDGIRLSGEGNEFNFTITSKTATKIAIPYEITARRELEVNNSDNLDPSVVRIYLAKVETGLEDEQVLLDYFDKLGTPEKTGLDTTIERLLYTGKVPSEQPNYEQHFKLKMWIDNKTNFSAEKNEDGSYKTDGEGNLIYPYNNKKFTIKVNVYSHGDVLTDTQVLEEKNTNLSKVKVGNTELTKVTGQSYQYETTLPEGTTETIIEIETENENAKVKVEKVSSLAINELPKVERLAKKETVDLDVGNNYFKVTVTPEVGNSVYYGIKIYVEKPAPLLTSEIFRVYPNYDTVVSNTDLQSTSDLTNQHGLYKSTQTNNGQPTYYFRGNVTNNYVSFAGKIWRVVRINEDGTIRIVMQENLNNSFTYSLNDDSYGLDNVYYSNGNTAGTAQYELNQWYTSNIINKNLAGKVADGNYFCEQAKVGSSNSSIGSAAVTVYTSYNANFRCCTDGNGYGIVPDNPKIGLLTYDEIVHAGLYYRKSTSNYLNSGVPTGKSTIRIITMSPCYLQTSNNLAAIWTFEISISGGEKLSLNYAGPGSKVNSLRPVINLLSTTKVLGDGTNSKPWVVQ